MASNLKENRKTSHTISSSVEVSKKKEVPKGATIVSKTIRVETEKIENGWLLTKNYDISYREKGKEYNDYAYFNKKWFSKTDPLDIELEGKPLADIFEDIEVEGE